MPKEQKVDLSPLTNKELFDELDRRKLTSHNMDVVPTEELIQVLRGRCDRFVIVLDADDKRFGEDGGGDIGCFYKGNFAEVLGILEYGKAMLHERMFRPEVKDGE